MPLTKQSLLAAIKPISDIKRLVLAFSGGLDSSVLLHLCVQNQEYFKANGILLDAVYIDHQLQSESAFWLDFCQQRCQQYQIPFLSIAVNARPEKRQSPEAAARDARYQAFRQILNKGEVLLTAHHQSDQAETLLLQMLRGSGPKGLAAMPIIKLFNTAFILRPLLNFSQLEIRAYADKYNLEWIDDKSNFDMRFKRNFLRHQIIPAIMEQWPGMEKTLSRVAHHQAESAEILEEMATIDINTCAYQEKIDGSLEYIRGELVLSLQRLRQLSVPRFNNCIQYWLRAHQAAVLNSALLERLRVEFLSKKTDTKALLEWQDKTTRYALRRFKDFLVLCFEKSFDSSKTYHWDVDLKRNRMSRIETIAGTIDLSESNGANTTALDPQQLNSKIEIRFRQGGEVFNLANGSHHSLKKWMQEKQVPPWLRNRMPLFYCNNQLFQVANRLLDKNFEAKNIDKAVYLNWHFNREIINRHVNQKND